MTETHQSHQPESVLNVDVTGAIEQPCKDALQDALELLTKKLPPQAINLISGTKIVIANGLIVSGGLTKAEEKEITLDAQKNSLSLQAAEDYLVDMQYLDRGDWTNALSQSKNNAWSCLTYQLIHEFGHLIDGLSIGDAYQRLPLNVSPTKYGRTSPSEAFAEAFTYWVLGVGIDQEAERTIVATLNSVSESP